MVLPPSGARVSQFSGRLNDEMKESMRHLENLSRQNEDLQKRVETVEMENEALHGLCRVAALVRLVFFLSVVLLRGQRRDILTAAVNPLHPPYFLCCLDVAIPPQSGCKWWSPWFESNARSLIVHKRSLRTMRTSRSSSRLSWSGSGQPSR
mgnify:FL=1